MMVETLIATAGTLILGESPLPPGFQEQPIGIVQALATIMISTFCLTSRRCSAHN
jgi:hypothetical protein